MTIGDLIDYLQQFDSTTRIVLSEADIESPGEFVALDILDYSDCEDES
jgi:hypothetical protein